MSMPPTNPYGSPLASTNETAYVGSQRRLKKLRRIEPLSLGLMQGALFALMGLIPGVFFAFMAIVGGGMDGAGNAWAAGLVGGVIMAILAPFIYGVMGFISGIILALLYNLCATFLGGVELEFEE